MRAQQRLHGPTLGQHRRVPNAQTVFVHPDLHRRSHRVVAVHQRIEQGLTQCGTGHRECLHTHNALVGNDRLQVLGQQQIQRVFDLVEQIAFHLVVVQQFSF